VIVGVGEDDYSTSSDLVTKIDPSAEFAGAIDDRLVPGGGLLLDAFAIAEPADVGPVRGDGIEVL
jgi:hypothetical protein